MKVTPYLNFDGNCKEAMTHYERVLGGKIDTIMPYRGSPMEAHAPPGGLDRIMHASLTFGDQKLLGSDAPPGRYERPQGVWVSLHVDTAAEAERIWNDLASGANVVMPIDKTFWAERFGMLVDRYGTPWMVDCDAKQF
jgi:PhnB protein